MIGFPLFSIDNRPLKVHWTTGPDPWIGPFLEIGLWDPFNKRSFDHWSILDPYENRSICLAVVGTLGLQGFPRNFNYSGHGPSSVIFLIRLFSSYAWRHLCKCGLSWRITRMHSARVQSIQNGSSHSLQTCATCPWKKSSNYQHNAIVANEGTAEYIQEQDDDKSFGSVSRNPG